MIKTTKKMKLFRLENAQTMVEFALVFPLILIITYGMIELGRMVWIYAAVTTAAREGARYGAASGNAGGKLFYQDCTGIKNAVKRTAILVPITDANISISYDNGTSPSRSWASCPPPKNPFDWIESGDRIIVRVSATYQPVIGFLGIQGFTITSRNARTILSRIELGP